MGWMLGWWRPQNPTVASSQEFLWWGQVARTILALRPQLSAGLLSKLHSSWAVKPGPCSEWGGLSISLWKGSSGKWPHSTCFCISLKVRIPRPHSPWEELAFGTSLVGFSPPLANVELVWPLEGGYIAWVSFTGILWVQYDYYSYFTDEDTEMQWWSHSHTGGRWWSWDTLLHLPGAPSHTLPPPHFHTNTSNCNCQVCWWMSKVRILIKVSLFTGHMLQLKLHQNLPQISASRERAFCEHLVCDQFMWEPREGSYSFTHWINIYWAPTMCQTLRCWGKSSEQDRQVPGLMEIAF